MIKEGKQIDSYYVIKALQLCVEGVSFQEIEKIVGRESCFGDELGKKIQFEITEKQSIITYKVLDHVELMSSSKKKRRSMISSVV